MAKHKYKYETQLKRKKGKEKKYKLSTMNLNEVRSADFMVIFLCYRHEMLNIKKKRNIR